jgi:hypothetical protein
MTPTESGLREEAEKVAEETYRQVALSSSHKRNMQIIADTLVAFAQRHGGRERLRGRIEERSMHYLLDDEQRVRVLRAQLAALEKGEEVTG